MFDPENYQIICHIFPRFVGIMYFFALFPFLFQIKGLIGKNGIQPIDTYLAFFRARLKGPKLLKIPTLFWWKSSDSMLLNTVGFGVVCSILLALGFLPWLFIPILIVIHLSIISTGQEFLSFGWEMFFLEISYNAFLLSLTNHPNLFVWISLNLLIFRFHFQAGASKLQTRDPTWKNLSALCYHYQTQPIPNPVAWYFHKLPTWFHKFSTGFMFFAELVVPFGIFGGEDIRFATFILLFSLQFFIAVSGNYSYLNYLTMVLISLLVGDKFLSPLLGPPATLPESPWSLQATASIGAIILIALQLMQLYDHFIFNPWIKRFLNKIYPFHFANRYGIFAVMTTTRYEIVIKGSDDNQVWKEYLFYFKPSEVERRPGIISPFQPRLDWQVWFLPFTTYHQADWFQNFLVRLLEGEPEVLKLMRHNPFPGRPPKYIKADLYVYVFSTRKIRKETGHWWVRTYLGKYSPILYPSKLKIWS